MEIKKDPSQEQIGGNHYKSLVIQPTEYIFKNKLGFLEGNVIKYITRHKNKNGIEDLKKAIHFIELIIKFEEDERKIPDAFTPEGEKLRQKNKAEGLLTGRDRKIPEVLTPDSETFKNYEKLLGEDKVKEMLKPKEITSEEKRKTEEDRKIPYCEVYNNVRIYEGYQLTFKLDGVLDRGIVEITADGNFSVNGIFLSHLFSFENITDIKIKRPNEINTGEAADGRVFEVYNNLKYYEGDSMTYSKGLAILNGVVGIAPNGRLIIHDTYLSLLFAIKDVTDIKTKPNE